MEISWATTEAQSRVCLSPQRQGTNQGRPWLGNWASGAETAHPHQGKYERQQPQRPQTLRSSEAKLSPTGSASSQAEHRRKPRVREPSAARLQSSPAGFSQTAAAPGGWEPPAKPKKSPFPAEFSCNATAPLQQLGEARIDQRAFRQGELMASLSEQWDLLWRGTNPHRSRFLPVRDG